MTDKQLQDLRDEHAAAVDQQVATRSRMEELRKKIRAASAETLRLNVECKELAEPYKLHTEQVASLSAKILEEERRRAAEVKEAQEEHAD